MKHSTRAICQRRKSHVGKGWEHHGRRRRSGTTAHPEAFVRNCGIHVIIELKG